MRLALLVAVLPVLQVTLAERLPWGGPDLVLLAVVMAALARGPQWGAVYGFAGGLAVDLTPPADHTVGLSALVLCLVGFACGLRDLVPPGGSGPSPMRVLTMAATGTYGGLLLFHMGEIALGHAAWDPLTLGKTMVWTVAGGSLAVTALLARRERRRARAGGVDPRMFQMRGTYV